MILKFIFINKLKMRDILYLAFMTTIEMMRDRGYVIPEKYTNHLKSSFRYPEEEFHKIINRAIKNGNTDIMTLMEETRNDILNSQKRHKYDFIKDCNKECEKVNTSIESYLTEVYEHSTNGDKCLVYFAGLPQKEKMGKEYIKQVIIMLENIECDHVIMIIGKKLTPDAINQIKKLTVYTFEIFEEKDLTYNPTKHIYVPKHVPLSEEEVKELDSDELDKFPMLLKTDIICRYHGFKEGQIVKIYNNTYLESMIKKYITIKRVGTIENVGNVEDENAL